MPVKTRVGVQAVSIGHLTVAKLVGSMMQKPRSIDDLCSITGLNRTTVLHYVRALRQERACFVACWSKDAIGRISIAKYALGHHEDAARPRKPRAQVVADWKAKRLNLTCDPDSLKWARSIVAAQEKREAAA